MLLGLYTRMQTAWFSMTARLRDETGAVAAEYGLLLTLIAIAIIAAATFLGTAIADRFTEACNALDGTCA